ncbi:MAG: mechanosensitive ion channel [Desulfuromonadales bacterium]
MRIDDVVIVDNEWGQVEEITLTYVVVRIWDLRRLVVPTSYFLEKSFQNWTRTSADLLGAVMIYADYQLPVEAVRQHLGEIVKDHALWDGKVWRLHVTNATEKTVELRALVSAASSGDAWELRCDIREKLLAFLQTNYPHCLPKVRAEITPHEAAV